jgi:hypothetical protein
VLSPSSKNSNLNLLDFSKVGLSTLSDTSAFKKTQYFSKVSPQSLYSSNNFEDKYSKISDLYLKSSGTLDSYNYGTFRQHNYTTSASNQYKQGLIDKKSVDKILDYNYNVKDNINPSFSNESVNLLENASSSNASMLNNLYGDVNATNLNVSISSENPTLQNSNNSTSDAKGHANSLKYSTLGKATSLNVKTLSDLQELKSNSLPYQYENESPRTFKFKEPSSSNLSFLSSEKNVRLIDSINPTKFNPSISNSSNNLEELVADSIGESIVPNMSSIYSSSKNG